MDASSVESLERGYLQIAEACGLGGSGVCCPAVVVEHIQAMGTNLGQRGRSSSGHLRVLPVSNRRVVLVATRNLQYKIYATVGSTRKLMNIAMS